MLRKFYNSCMKGMGVAKPNVKIVRLNGAIQAPAAVQRPHIINHRNFEKILEDAFEDSIKDKSEKTTKAVALVMNCPGGSPVQSSLIYKKLRALKAKHNDVALHCIVEDVCASGGYYIAAACDDIMVNESSVVGSIGVVRQSIGIHQFIKKYGIESRNLAIGRSKAVGSPLEEEKKIDRRILIHLMNQIFKVFVSDMRVSRGNKFNEQEATRIQTEEIKTVTKTNQEEEGGSNSLAEASSSHIPADELDLYEDILSNYDKLGLFDGSVYVGEQAVAVGMADGIIGDYKTFFREKYGEDIKIVEMKTKPSFPFANLIGGSLMSGAMDAFESKTREIEMKNHTVGGEMY
eukprot:g3384.t1